MLTALLTAAVLAVPQDPPRDQAQVFVDSSFGVSIAQPGAGWVLEPARTRTTTTVMFYPTGSPSAQLFGALVMTRFARPISLSEVADRRVAEAWQPTLGPTFSVLTRDSLTVAGVRALHVVMTGSINRVPIDVEEYLLSRGNDLILLQFRYPHDVSRDSASAAYDRALRSLTLYRLPLGGTPVPLAAAPQATPPAPAPPRPVRSAAPPAEVFVARPRRETWSVLAGSAWRAARIDVSVQLDSPSSRLAWVTRFELLNDALEPADSVRFWLPDSVTVDSVRVGATAVRARLLDHGLVVPLPDAVAFEAEEQVTLYFRGQALAARAAFTDDWLPAVSPPFDSLGHLREVAHPVLALRFDLPDGISAVATGRLTAGMTASGRHRQTWIAEDAHARRPGFVVGRFVPLPRMAGRLALTIWSPLYSDAPLDSCARLVAAAWAWHARALGAVAPPEAHVVVGAPVVRGLPGLLLLNEQVADDALVVHREVARTWWGGAVRAAGPGAAWIEESWPVWSALASLPGIDVQRVAGNAAGDAVALAQLTGDSSAELDALAARGVLALDVVRQAAGEARFREAMRTLVAEHREGFVTLAGFLPLLTDEARLRVREFLYP